MDEKKCVKNIIKLQMTNDKLQMKERWICHTASTFFYREMT